MKKILVTGFLPFNGRDINPSEKIVEMLTAPKNAELVKYILPVEYKRSGEILTEIVDKENPDVLVSIGQAGNNPYVAVERVAVNLDNSLASDGVHSLADQAGYAPVDEPVSENGPAAYFSTLPVWELVRAASEKTGVPVRASYSAGTFICNHVMYTGCSLAEKRKNMISGFIHVPFLPEQLGGKKEDNRKYSMPFEDMLSVIQTVICELA